ncbi:FAD-binding oxidoreductase [Pseudohongiella sp.]|uniref:FAD-binding PCMH-type domain-containing protein n=1 Tax=marine sediment metagenome TaxID=412755 RepID=A0A0F9YQK9_9ZZZZ|nr:FAD-binding oxidoreductase [Pseudohongiella sp.]HDZ10220.1 FAD-binding oxidoreductase [Pseudohongiella sp.]HEA62236.1 FAD-binding oxidoreductase [Pseudohongiella sp.]
MKITSWGRLRHEQHNAIAITNHRTLSAQIQHSAPGISYGMGRSYGDICLNPDGWLWQTRGMNRFISFDQDTGLLSCEAGVILKEIQDCLAPRGWLLPVTPGTQLVTVGGAIANDVHGKNHHVMGTFGEHVTGFRLERTDGTTLDCSREHNADMFRATIGGLGLTGVISRVQLQLRRIDSPWLLTDTVAFSSLDDFFALADDSEADWEHTVSWIDCLAGPQTRGIFMRANHARAEDLAAMPEYRQAGGKPPRSAGITMPLTPPVSLVNKLSLRAFNAAYFAMNARKAGAGVAHYESFFYPLDKINHWNRMYGRRGFYQYQCVVPRTTARQAIADMLAVIAAAGEGSFLAVLKTFADRPAAGLLSFPMEGATLALDFPNKGARTAQLFTRLDEVVTQAGGRLYAAKDARMSAQMFASAYPALAQFSVFRDPGISSAMSRRLLGS